MPTRSTGYRTLRANLAVWGVPLLIVGTIILTNVGSGVTTSPPSGSSALVHCEGFTWIDPEDCHPWAAEVLKSEIPSGHSIDQVERLDIKRSLFGLLDHCTAEYAFVGGARGEREIQCR